MSDPLRIFGPGAEIKTVPGQPIPEEPDFTIYKIAETLGAIKAAEAANAKAKINGEKSPEAADNIDAEKSLETTKESSDVKAPEVSNGGEASKAAKNVSEGEEWLFFRGINTQEYDYPEDKNKAYLSLMEISKKDKSFSEFVKIAQDLDRLVGASGKGVKRPSKEEPGAWVPRMNPYPRNRPLKDNYPPELASHRDRAFPTYPRDLRICPRKDFPVFIEHLTSIRHHEKALGRANGGIRSSTIALYDHYGLQAPPMSQFTVLKQRCYQQTIDAFLNIREELSKLCKGKGKPQDDPAFDPLIASLEIVGAIMLNPWILENVNEVLGGPEEVIFLYTSTFTTSWTAAIIDCVTWPSDQSGLVFSQTKRSELRFGALPRNQPSPEPDYSDSDY